MQHSKVKILSGENKRLRALNAQLSATNESMSMQLKQKDDALAKRRGEVATLYQACAKNKRARIVFAQQLRSLKVATGKPSSLDELEELEEQAHD